MTLSPQDRSKYAEGLIVKKRKETIIDRANELVDIRDIYNLIPGCYAPLGEYQSWKINCPFFYEHADGGIDKNTRIYPPNHIFCWASHGQITPTYLYARLKGMPSKMAAEELLKERGLLQAKNFREQWNMLIEEREEKLHNKLGSQNYAIEALRKALVEDENYSSHEYDSEVRQEWVFVLNKLDELWEIPETDISTLILWLDKSTKRIKRSYSSS